MSKRTEVLCFRTQTTLLQWILFPPYWARNSRPNIQSEFYMTANQTKWQYWVCLEEECLEKATWCHGHTHHSSQLEMPLRRIRGAKPSPQCYLEKPCNCGAKTLQRKKKILNKEFFDQGFDFCFRTCASCEVLCTSSTNHSCLKSKSVFNYIFMCEFHNFLTLSVSGI